MNKVILLGRMTKEPTIRYTPTGKAVANVTLAVDKPYRNEDGTRDADFIPIVVWGKAAEHIKVCGYKGCHLLVEGRLQIRNFDAADNTKHWVAEIVVSYYEFTRPQKKADTEEKAEPVKADANNGDVPFDVMAELHVTAHEKWDDLANVPVHVNENNDTIIDTDWEQFPAGTPLKDSWKWFETTYKINVSEELMS